MFKIIDLDIDETLSAETRVSEVGLVFDPAIETQFVYFSKQNHQTPITKVRDFAMDMFHVKQEKFESITDYPQYITDNALKAKNWVEENGYGSCMTPVGKARLNQLANKEPISLETLKRMKAYADRHKKDLEVSKSFDDGCGMLAWYSWGLDDSGRVEKWLESQITKYEEMDYVQSLPQYTNYATGDTENDMLIEPIEFIEKIPYERKDEYVSRCVAWHIKNKGWDEKQSYAVCISQAEEAFLAGERVSFDYDDTLSTFRGKGLALHEKNTGSILYIISARQNKEGMLKVADELGIPHDRVFATGSNRAKIRKIKELRIQKHYDNNEEVIDQLGSVGIDFGCECLDKFSIVGYIDGEPIFNTVEEAELYGMEEHGCSGHHTHIDENGNEVYMACEIHPEEMSYDFGVDEYSEEEKEAVKYLQFLAETDITKYEQFVSNITGVTERTVLGRKHRTPVVYYRYDRDSSIPLTTGDHRQFCMEREGRYFTRFEIDLMTPLNKEFGHKRQSYSKWLYLGGPNCIHYWTQVTVLKGQKVNEMRVPGSPGTPMKTRPLNGYYSEETKRKSEIAYIVSQQNMSKQQFKSDNDKRMIYSPLMLPNVLIPRIDNGEKYFVRFTPQAIEKIQRKFMVEQRLRDTNLEHSNHKFKDIVMVESWIITGEKDKAYELGFTKEQAPIGSWMAGYKVLETPEGDEIWNDYIKSGKVRGFSVEGEFLLKFAKQNFNKYDELLEKVVNILKQVE